ncbi:RNA polymerase sigma factor SigC [Mycobacterium tuberculosis]|nr:RNA polymerase sigma factor SigC [Mycobacterium tuberculosis]
MIADLTTDQREALLLTQLLGLSYADAAAAQTGAISRAIWLPR